MSSSARRNRSLTATSTSTPPPLTEFTATIRELLLILQESLQNPTDSRSEDIAAISKTVQTLQQCLSKSPRSDRPKDAFRHLNGFQTILDTIRSASGFYHPTRRTQDEKERLFGLLRNTLALLSEAFRGHHGNRRYFRRRVEGGGWTALEQAIASIGFGGSDFDTWSENQLFGILLAFAVDDEGLNSLCQDMQDNAPDNSESTFNGLEKRLLIHQKHEESTIREAEGFISESRTVLAPINNEQEFVSFLARNVRERLEGIDVLWNPEIAPTIIGFWKSLPRSRPLIQAPASMVVILTLSRVCSFSQSNLLGLHSTGILSSVLPLAFEEEAGLSTHEQEALNQLCASLMSIGLNSLDDARYLLRSRSPKAADFLLEMTKVTQNPPHIQFDLSLNGYSSIELPTLGRQFPPPSSAPGYTFTAWIYIDRFDPDAHTTIFGAFDLSQTCFVLAYLEKDTQNFILQTSVTSSRPSVRFKNTVFKENRWYYIAVVHRRPRAISSSKAALYVDGEFVEQVKCQYPSLPPPSNSSTESFASFSSSSTKLNPVHSFLGTPQDLSSRLGHGLVLSKWSLASAHLFEDALSDDVIAVHYRLGPRYNGNFQDCLGSFQTYEASAALSMRNDLMHPGKDEKSEIITAIRDKASNLVPETKILLSILPTAIFGDDIQGELDISQLVSGLSTSAAKTLYRATHSTGTSVAINAAVPCYNDALTSPNGVASLKGGPVVIVPQALDDAMWRLGGCTAIGMKLVDAANSREDIVRAVQIFFESIKGSWRNSEAMERENGYAILAALLRGKLSSASTTGSANSPIGEALTISTDERDKLSLQLLSVVLEFVGYNHEVPEESMINNPMAYRTLLADFDMWRKSAPPTQTLYYKQFITFAVQSKHHHYNSRRLIRMRIVRRFIDALKAESFSQDVFPSFIEAFSVLVISSLNAEILRSLALFITYSFHKPNSSASRTPKVKYGTVSSPKSISSASKRLPVSTLFDSKFESSPVLSKREIGRGILQMYTDILCEKGSTANLKRFAKTVTNKWLLHLLTEDDAEVVVLGTKILARLLIVHGSAYVKKFTDSTGGFAIMRFRLKRWWDIPTLYPILFGILFNYDVAEIDFERAFDLFSLSELFGGKSIVYPDALPIIVSMLYQGLNCLVHNQDDPDSPLHDRSNGNGSAEKLAVPVTGSRRRSMSLTKELEARQIPTPSTEKLGGQASVLHAVIQFLSYLHGNSQNFRDFSISSDYVRLLLGVLYPVVVNADIVSPETELNSRDSALTFEGEDVIIRPISRVSSMPSPVVRTTTVETHLDQMKSGIGSRAKPLRRGSSFILLTAKRPDLSPSPAKLTGASQPQHVVVAQKVSNDVVEELLELVISVFIDQILVRKEFPGFSLFLKIPPGFQEHQAYFESYILRNTISHLFNTVQLQKQLLLEPKVIMNMARFTTYMGEAVYEGWFLGGAEPLLDFAGHLLDYLQQPDVSKTKSVRLCSQAIQTIRGVFLRVVLLRLSEIDGAEVTEEEAIMFMNKLLYWQTIFLSAEASEGEFLKLMCYQLYTKLVDPRQKIRLAAADLWRILLVQKPEETSAILVMSMDKQKLISGFKKLMELDNETFVEWVMEHRDELDRPFFGGLSRTWEDFVNVENAKTDETAKLHLSKRKDRLKQWQSDERNDADVLLRHDLASSLWGKNIYAAEHLKHLRTMQDQQDNVTYLASSFAKMDRDLHRTCAVFDKGTPCKWRLDQTEGRNRMRLRLIPDRSGLEEYQPKRKGGGDADADIRINTTVTPASPVDNITATPTPFSATYAGLGGSRDSSTAVSIMDSGKPDPDAAALAAEDDFELIDDPNDNEDGFEDKQRKVMRSLKRGDQVQHVFNVSRIIGLEACEGLLILGKDCLYLIDDFFQRSDGEIVNVWDAPLDERDPYVQMISGKEVKGRPSLSTAEQESRSWKWSEVLSVSKRRFLFRDVAVEVFFTDGRSYLLTALDQVLRNDLHAKMTSKAPQLSDKASPADGEEAWRMEALKAADEAPITFGSRLAGLMNSSAWNPSMRRWAKGEMSNFHYLMLVNTMAGRTFNDLTQYPVFPWIIADYTSEELDFENPATFRDLSKPMGCQNPGREADFVERYKTFAEMGEENPFHYGTHYTSAMIVASYLIRLQPFVQSYLLIQGGNFDHPDRMFYSIEKAWRSASRDNMTDVRELTPEFFYLPEFLTNSNGFNFGLRQGNGGSIDNVELPPWAKGDPKIFIAKNREALESPYVSAHLHEWIDLVFGCKQNGDAAIENTNVFHHLSYRGATDLDAMTDHREKLQTISIIHNFGQTPHQVFIKPHQPREDWRNKPRRLDTSAESLTRLPFPLFEHSDSIASLTYSAKLDRLLCGSAFRLNMPPLYDKYMEWGFADNSVRFYAADSRKLLGLFENLHQGQLSAATFADSKTLVTAGVDCVLSVWSVSLPATAKSVDLAPKTSLFGHKQPVSTIAVSKSFSTILSASTDGVVILWDLNRLEFVRKLAAGRGVQCARINSVTGDVMLCRGQKVALYTLNGDLILDQNVCDEADDYVSACAFYEGVGNEWVENTLVFTGHRRGVVKCWRKAVGRGRGGWGLELVKRLEGAGAAAVTAVLPMPTAVYTGDEEGKAYEWTCVRREK